MNNLPPGFIDNEIDDNTVINAEERYRLNYGIPDDVELTQEEIDKAIDEYIDWCETMGEE